MVPSSARITRPSRPGTSSRAGASRCLEARWRQASGRDVRRDPGSLDGFRRRGGGLRFAARTRGRGFGRRLDDRLVGCCRIGRRSVSHGTPRSVARSLAWHFRTGPAPPVRRPRVRPGPRRARGLGGTLRRGGIDDRWLTTLLAAGATKAIGGLTVAVIRHSRSLLTACRSALAARNDFTPSLRRPTGSTSQARISTRSSDTSKAERGRSPMPPQTTLLV